jgi:predicted S18 family serine protease
VMKKSSELVLFLLATLIVVVTFLGGIITGRYATTTPENGNAELIEHKRVIVDGEMIRQMTFVAVDGNGGGVSGTLTAELKDGDGKVLVNINQVLIDVQLQQSAGLAVEEAAGYTKSDLDDIDVIFNIEIAEASIVSGGSAGAGMTVAVASLFSGQQLRDDVIIGSIEEGVIMGQAGSIQAKAQAAEKAGAKILLIPVNSGNDVSSFKRIIQCGEFNDYEYCNARTVKEIIKNSEDAGVQIIQVKDLKEAMEYMVKKE